jgi:aspartyl protease family protein
MRLIGLATSLLLVAGNIQAVDINMVGLFPGKAVLVIDNGSPKTYAVNSVLAEGIKLVNVSDSSAIIDIKGKRQILTLGQHINQSSPAMAGSATLQADSRGHFMAQAQINGSSLRMPVDTGATMIALPAAEALRLGIDYKNGQSGHVNTANGRTPVFRVKLDTVKIGDIELNQIDAVIHENGLPLALLGMSFLNRTDMRRNGEQMTLTKRF